MPYGHLEQYRNLLRRAEKQRIAITKEQQRQISKLYEQIANGLTKQLKHHSPGTLDYRWLKDYAKSLKDESKALRSGLKDIITGNMLAASQDVTDAQERFYSKLCPQLSERFRDVFSTIPQKAVNELLSGEMYKDFRGLSERLWDYSKQYNRDIQYIINQGILAQKSAYDLAKDLEQFLNPKAKLPFDWSKVYPRSQRVVDYSAQRLARTSVTHAYQLAMVRSTRDNPYVEKYKWLSSNAGRTCPLCASRDGELFDKDDVPFDHPNGMCVLVPVITKSYDEIAEELGDWANGEDNPALNQWLNPHEKESIIKMGNKEVREYYYNQVSRIQKQLNTTQSIEKQARQAFALRNQYRDEARALMNDLATLDILRRERPNKSFEELIESKMKRKGMSRDEAIQDILDTATKTNEDVNKLLGIGGKEDV